MAHKREHTHTHKSGGDSKPIPGYWGPRWVNRTAKEGPNAKKERQFRWQFSGNSKQFGPPNGNSQSRRRVETRRKWQFAPRELRLYKTREGGEGVRATAAASRILPGLPVLEFYLYTLSPSAPWRDGPSSISFWDVASRILPLACLLESGRVLRTCLVQTGAKSCPDSR